MDLSTKVKSSGVIFNGSTGLFNILIIQVINNNPTKNRSVQVQVFNWENNTPVAVAVGSLNGPNNTPGGGGPIEIQEGTGALFLAGLNGLSQYEVRVTYFNSTEDVLVTSQGFNLATGNLIGQTVLDRDFRRIDVD